MLLRIRSLVLVRDPLASKSSNNFNLLRILAAVGVIYGHAFGMFPMPNHTDFFAKILNGFTYSGQIAVLTFFFLSGILVTRSAINSPSISFIVKRVLRIYPALFASLVITIVAIKLLVYRALPLRSAAGYILVNFGTLTNRYFIPGVFPKNQYHAINGSLWTLPNEVRLYLILALMLIFFQRINKRILLGVFCLGLFYFIAAPTSIPLIGTSNATFGNQLFLPNSLAFIMGGIGYLLGSVNLRPAIALMVSGF